MNKNSKLVIKNAIIFIVVLAIIIVAVQLGLKKYTHHSEVIIVPDITSLSVEEAAVFIEKKGLRYKVVDSLHVKSRLPGTIIEQKPTPGSKVKLNRFVFLTINASNDEKIVMPDVMDFSQRQAMATLSAVGINVADVEYVPSEFRDLVLDVKYNGRVIPPGVQLPRNSQVTLVVGQGDSKGEILTPSLIGMTMDDAIENVHQKSLNMGDLHFDKTPKNPEEAKSYMVYRQDPKQGSPVSMGQKIDLWMTTDVSLIEDQSDFSEEDIEISE